MNVWWCNQSRCWRLERVEGVVCASDQMDNCTYRETVLGVIGGDVVVHYVKGRVVAFSQAQEDGTFVGHLPPPFHDDYSSGWRFRTQYFDLAHPIPKAHFTDALVRQIVKHYPIDKRGNVRQGYFFPFDRAGLRVVLSCSHDPVPGWLRAAAFDAP